MLALVSGIVIFLNIPSNDSREFPTSESSSLSRYDGGFLIGMENGGVFQVRGQGTLHPVFDIAKGRSRHGIPGHAEGLRI
jgi:hypothetical protein